MTAVAKKQYPRALPLRSPEDFAEETARWRRRTYRLMIAAAVLSLLATASVVLAWKYRPGETAKKPDAEAAQVEPVVKPTVPAAPVSEPPVAPAVKQVEPVQPRTPPAPVAREATTSPREGLLEALGSLSAAHLYQSYLNIGLLADGVESEAYSRETAEETLTTIVEVIDQVNGELKKLAQLGLAREDQAAVEQITIVSGLLRLQAGSLRAFWKSGQAEQAETYHDARKAAWKGLSKIVQKTAP